MKWTKKPLVKVADFCLGKMLDDKKNRGEPLPYLANINVRWGDFDIENLREMRFEHDEMDRYGLKYGDIVMCEGGEPGRCAIWKEPVPGMMIQKALHRIRPHDCIDHRFLYYSFLHKGKTGGFAPLFTGATIKHLPRQQLAKVEIEFPPLEVQRRIADFLSAYDDLIENNRRRMALLEDAVRQLYKEWFVYLHFPGHEHCGIAAGVPAGWTKNLLSEICYDVRDQVDPKTLSPDVPYVGLEHIPRRSITIGDWGRAADVESTKYKFNEGDILFGKIRPYFHKVGFACASGITSSDAIVIRASSTKFYYYCMALLSSDEFVALASQTMREGSKMPRADWNHLQGCSFLLPPWSLLEVFDDFVSPIIGQLKNLVFQIRQLSEARSLLLPRLVSGQIKV